MTSRLTKSSVFATLALAAVAGSTSAQRATHQTPQAAPQTLTTPIVQLPTYHYDVQSGTGTFDAPASAQQGGAQRALATCYSNTVTVGSFTTVTAGMEFVDWGDKACSTTGFIDGFSFAYATTAVDPSLSGPGASLDIALYQGTSGGGSSFLGTEIARFNFTGLPGSTTGTPAGYFIPVTGIGPLVMNDGDIGWGYVGVDGMTGPLLITTTGTCFAVPDPATGTEDCFDIFTAPAPTGPFIQSAAFGTPNISSFYLTIDEYDGSSTVSVINNGTGFNPVLYTEVAPPVLSQPWLTTVDLTGFPGAASVIAICDDPFGPVIIGIGELLVNIGTPSLLMIDISLGNHSNQVPQDLTLIGNTIHTQGAIFSGGALSLVNGIDFTLGL